MSRNSSASRSRSKSASPSKKRSKSNKNWTIEEHVRFLKGIQVFGRDWDNVAETVQTHTVSEVRAYAEKHDRRQQMSPGRKKKPCLQDFNLQTLRDIEDRLGTDDDFVWEPPSKVSRTH